MNSLPVFELTAVPRDQAEQMLQRARVQMAQPDYQLIEQSVRTLEQLQELLQHKDMSLRKLRRMLFGERTEKTHRVCGGQSSGGRSSGSAPLPRPRPKGHGRHGARDYPGAQRVPVGHTTLAPGHTCPGCGQGQMYRLSQPAQLLHLMAQPIFPATLYELEKLRCNRCGQVHTAQAPAEAGTQKYDLSVASMLALLRYGSGVPFYRIARLQRAFGVPLPDATQWEQVEALARELAPVYQELQRQAAQQPVLHNDDTSMRVLHLQVPVVADNTLEPAQAAKERTGVFTSGIVATGGSHTIALYFTGRRHAGENLDALLGHRDPDLPMPIQMCDGLSRNPPKEFATLLSNCVAHGRRQFVEIAAQFPAHCQQVLESLRQVYQHDAQAKEQGLSPQARLEFHQTHSRPVMDQLQQWMQSQLDTNQVEPNSGLGQAMNYLLKRWQPLTLFLRQPGAPLDNNICERALKKAILHRKNSLCYKTEHGAEVGDLFMSLIHTCEYCGANPFDYLNSLQRHLRQMQAHPEQWLPWNYQKNFPSEDTG
ncbi:MAG TPA: IS66 family transposase [Candidatus Sulfotelmatobacter sp.]|nr:IS66 family transposase [Candidatus Sulfotelmatobacter sp.]